MNTDNQISEFSTEIDELIKEISILEAKNYVLTTRNLNYEHQNKVLLHQINELQQQNLLLQQLIT